MASLIGRLDPSNRRVVELAAAIAADRGRAIWLVGGPVRDLLLGRPIRDLDLVVEDGAAEVAESLAHALGAGIRRHDRFLTFEIATGDIRIDITTSRRERYPSPGDLPIVEPGPIESDLRRRDFTINAIAIRLSDGELFDPVRGRDDIESKTLRVLHGASFSDDPTRIMRALRLAVRLQFDLADGTLQSLGRAIAAGALDTISNDRFWREILLAFGEDDPGPVLGAFAERNVFSHLIPDLDLAVVSRQLELATKALESHPEASSTILCLGALFANRLDALSQAPFADREKRRIAAAARDASTILDALRRDGDPVTRLRALRAFDAEPLALAAATEPSTRDAVDVALAARALRLPFTADAIGLPPGQHLGEALWDTREAIAAGKLEAGDSLRFARERALRYLSRER